MHRLSGRTRLSLALHGLLDLAVGSWFLAGTLFLGRVLYLAISGQWKLAPSDLILVLIVAGWFVLMLGGASVWLLLRSGSVLGAAISGRVGIPESQGENAAQQNGSCSRVPNP